MKNILVAAVLLGVLLELKSWKTGPRRQTSRPLIIYCAAGLKKPVEAIAQKYRAETGVEVQLQYGGTGALLTSSAMGCNQVPHQIDYRKGEAKEICDKFKPGLDLRTSNSQHRTANVQHR